MPSTKTLNQSPTIGEVENGDLLWIWDITTSTLNKVSRATLLTTTDDLNSSYARLAGRSGGQTLIGGTAANNDLTLEGTSNATRTTSYVILQPNGGNVGIGTTTPTHSLEIFKNVGPGLRITSNSDFPYIQLYNGGNTSNSRLLEMSADFDGYNFSSYNDDGTTNTQSIILLHSNGNVGIGTTSPSTRLDIDAGAIEFAEMTAPAAGAVNTGRLFCRDNGFGKTQLCIIFNTGAIQVIATQP